MEKTEVLGIVVFVSLIVFLGGVEYIYLFSGYLGNQIPMSPTLMPESIYFSPGSCECGYKSRIICEIIWEDCR